MLFRCLHKVRPTLLPHVVFINPRFTFIFLAVGVIGWSLVCNQGGAQGNVSASGSVIFPIAFSSFSCGVATNNSATYTLAVSSFDKTQFLYSCGAGGMSFRWIAAGI